MSGDGRRNPNLLVRGQPFELIHLFRWEHIGIGQKTLAADDCSRDGRISYT